jgi:hypothetical protein
MPWIAPNILGSTGESVKQSKIRPYLNGGQYKEVGFPARCQPEVFLMRAPFPISLLAIFAFRLCAGAAPGAQPGTEVTIDKTKTHLDFRVGKALVARYVIDPKAAKPYFWPLNVPSGKSITRAWPMEAAKGEEKDHEHHKSAWFCHGDVVPEGLEIKHKIKGVQGVDFWSESKGHGKIVCTKVGPVKQGKGSARVTTENEWRTADGQKVLDEKRTLHLLNLDGAWLLVLDSDLHASVYPITFADTKEGSFGVRVRQTVRADKGGVLVNAQGKKGEGELNNVAKNGCWGLISNWCDYSGPVEKETAGVAIFADPRNAVKTAWHSRNYGLMAANPFGRQRSGFPDMRGNKDLVKIKKGDHLRFRYAILLHGGDAKKGKVAEHFARFAKLPLPKEKEIRE